MMIFDVEHSCTDTREEQKQNNRLSALPWVGGMMGGGGGGRSLTASPVSCLAAPLSFENIYCFRNGRGKKKKEFSHDVL